MVQSRIGVDQEMEGRSLAGWEIASVVSSLLIAEWIVLSFAGRSKLVGAIPVVLAFVFMYLSHRIHGETMREVGFRTDNLLRAAKLLFLPTLAAGLLILVAGWINGGLRYGLIASRPRFLLLPLWAFAQQYVLQGFVNRRAQMVLSAGSRSVILVAAVFSLLHLPNLPLAAGPGPTGRVAASHAARPRAQCADPRPPARRTPTPRPISSARGSRRHPPRGGGPGQPWV